MAPQEAFFPPSLLVPPPLQDNKLATGALPPYSVAELLCLSLSLQFKQSQHAITGRSCQKRMLQPRLLLHMQAVKCWVSHDD